MADTLNEVAEVWTMTFKSSGQALSPEVDGPRFRAAFRATLVTAKEWQAPSSILDRLPRRPQLNAIAHYPVVTEEDRQKNLAMLQDLKLSLGMGPSPHDEGARARAHEKARLQ